MATNRRLAPVEDEFYVTPAWGTEALLFYESFPGRVLEPCCGDGAIAKVLRRNNYKVLCSDKYDRGYGIVQDFLSIKTWNDSIITNPPFDKAEELLDHAFSLRPAKVAFLLRLAFLEGQRRYRKFYDLNAPSSIIIFSERLSIYRASDHRNDGGTTAYAWFVWDFDLPVGDTVVRWIAPGLKARFNGR